ncbi:protein ENL isoform X2 [Pseudonaja textilis]|uniref:protein ENL isoform X2 n=1 Tax=Pseudonaja textilis TaxID=8673 RepID=UPI000EA95CC1|nr:protein ENL isoform X2 [Pseudonaja textilis]
MDNQCTVQVKLELGHRAQLRKKPTTEGFTHDWMVFVRGPEQFEIQHFVERVVFRLHQSFPKPKRVCKEPPYKVEESGYAGFIMPIEVYFKNKEEPKKVCFTYDLFLNLEGNPPVNHLRCEKLTFNNPTKEFRHKLIKAGGVMVMPEGAETVSRPSPDYPMLPTIPLSAFSDPKKSKPSHGSKEVNKEGGKLSKPHKVTREHRERPRKDSESKAASREAEREAGKAAKEPSKKHATENKGPKEEKPLPKAALKEAKLALKEAKLENASPKGAPPAPEGKPASAKRPLAVESPKPMPKKLKKNSSKGAKTLPTNTHRAPNPTAPANPANPTSSSSSYAEKKLPKEKGPSAKAEKAKPESEAKAAKKPVEVAMAEESNSEDEASLKSESAASSPSNSSSSSDSSSDSDFEPSQNHTQGPLRSMVEDLQSEESDDDDSSSGEEVAVKSTPISREARLSHSDSDTDNSADSCLPSRDTPPRQKGPPANNKVSGRKSPESCNKPEKILKKGTYDKAYTDELVELHRRLMALRERNVLQQIVNLIEETGHFNVTNTTFDFDLFSLDETTVRKLQSYLEAVAT